MFQPTQLNEAYIALFHKVLGKQLPAGQELPVGYVAVKRVTVENANCVFFLALGSRLDGNVCLCHGHVQQKRPACVLKHIKDII